MWLFSSGVKCEDGAFPGGSFGQIRLGPWGLKGGSGEKFFLQESITFYA